MEFTAQPLSTRDVLELILLSVQAIVVIATVYWAALQTKLLRRSIESTVYMGIVERGNALFEKVLDYPRTLGPLLFDPLKGSNTPQEETQQFMRLGYLMGMFNLFHVVFLSHSKGVVDGLSWNRWLGLISYFLRSHHEFSDYWRVLPVKQARYHPDFVKFIDDMIVSSDKTK